MLTYKQLAEMGYCPLTKYGSGKPLPYGYKLKQEVPDNIWKKMPLQLNIMYSTNSINGSHSLISFKEQK